MVAGITPFAPLIGGAVSGIGSIIGGSTAASGAEQAAQTQAAAQQAATQAALQEQQVSLGELHDAFGRAAGISGPIANLGEGYYQQLSNEVGSGFLGKQPDLTDLSQLPGYQFTLQQGLNAAQNAAASQGLGISGPAQKGAIGYAENLANTFGNNYLSNYWANQNNRFNMLANLMNPGLNAANQLTASATQLGAAGGTVGTSTGNTLANAITGTATGVANAQQAAANLQGAGFTGAGAGLSNALLTQSLLSRGTGGSTITPDQGLNAAFQSSFPDI
jgi:hypothetical protein